MALRAGGGRLVAARGRVVAAVGDAEPQLDLFGRVLPDALGEPVVSAVVLGPPRRPNAKPVLQLMRPDGRTIGYAKIGWNDLTRSLVANEARALAGWEADPPSTFSVPRALASFTWNGLAFVVVSPVPQHLRRPRGASSLPAAASALDVAAHAGLEEGPLVEAPFVARLLRDAAALDDEGVRAAATVAIDRAVAAAGERAVRRGGLHGDWGPWNMSRTPSGLHVWDWERAEEGVPVGVDTIHHCFQTRALRPSVAPADAMASGLAAARRQLLDLEVEPLLHRPVFDLYLTEVLMRLEAGRSAGVAVREPLRQAILTSFADPRRPA
jgi:hypothetical protein